MSALGLRLGAPGHEHLTRDDAREWLRTRLFSSRGNTVLSLVLLAILGWFTCRFTTWLAVEANFDVVGRTDACCSSDGSHSARNGASGRPLYGFLVALMWTWGAWGRVTPSALLAFAIFGALVMPVMAGASGTMQTAPAVGLAALAYLGARR